MKYSKEEVMQFVEEEDVKFIRLAFCDVFGKQKNIAIMPSELSRAFEYGIAFDGSAITGFGDETHSDLLLHPDPETLMLLPWRPEHGKVVRMFTSITYPDGTPFECDTRGILKEAIAYAQKEGYSFAFGAEQEFYLFLLDENGKPTKTPYDEAGYMDLAPDDRGENIRREICLTLEQMGIRPESSHHEEGPGQNEIDFRYSSPLSAADNTMTFQTVVNTVARRNGLYVDFSPKPLKHKPGNGFHINVSVSPKNNIQNMHHMIAGVLNRICEMTAFLNPTENSYARFGEDKAPAYVSWSRENRSQLVRIPASPLTAPRAELRSPDPSANPYIAFALVIYAALEGLKNKTELMPAADINLFRADEETLRQFEKIPQSLSEACSLAANSDFIKEHIPKKVLQIYCNQ
ncbi:MAG: glutamine synthetase family protein [Eubacteriales bacterium]|nr:glutamine synthetase family protein [Eubacteriales bacterium]